MGICSGFFSLVTKILVTESSMGVMMRGFYLFMRYTNTSLRYFFLSTFITRFCSRFVGFLLLVVLLKIFISISFSVKVIS